MRTHVIPSVTATLVVAAMLYQAKTSDPVLAEAPAVALGERPGFVSEEVPVSDAELKTLPGDTRFVKRAYRGGRGDWHQVTVVIGGRSKSSVHRPELCLPAQGFQMSAPRSLVAAGTDWHAVTLSHRDAKPMRFAYTFFNQEGFRTASHMRRILQDVWDRSVRGRIDRWVMVTVFSSAESDADLVAFLEGLKESLK